MPLKILVVDDEPQSLKATQSLLEPFECQVFGVTDSGEAARRLDSGKFDALFVDARMPGIDGFQLTRLVRFSPPNCRALVVLLAEEHDAWTTRAGFEAGASAVIGKPLNRRQVNLLYNLAVGNAYAELKRFARVPFRTVVGCRSAKRRFLTESTKIGEAGMLLHDTGGLTLEEPVLLEFRVPSLAQPFTVEATVAGHESQGRLAVQFEKLAEADNKIIQQLIQNLEDKPARRAA